MKLKKRVFLIVIFILVIGIIFGKNASKLFSKNKEETKPDIEEKKENPIEDPFILALKNEKYYIEENLKRYKVYGENKEIPTSKIVMDVNANVDKEKYIDVEKTQVSDDCLMLVNKYFYLTHDYEPEDLIALNSKYNMGANNKMRSEAAEFFMKMVDAALLDNIIIKNASGYRSYTYQANLYNNYVKRDGKEAADTYSARAGYSEHQTGLTTDVNKIDSSFEKTDAFRWLQKNAYKYGFILRFPKDKEYITGYKYEPWHYRYVGLKAAKQIYEENLTLEEYYAYYVQKEK